MDLSKTDLVVAATTDAYIKSAVTTSTTMLDRLVTSYSATIERSMHRYAERKARTEVVRVRRNATTLWVKGVPISSLVSLRYGSRAEMGDIEYLDEDSFSYDAESGRIDIHFGAPYRSGYVEVCYTGGMASTVDDFIAAYPDIAEAVALQVGYHFQRRTRPGSTNTETAGSKSFEGPVGLIGLVKRTIDLYRLGF